MLTEVRAYKDSDGRLFETPEAWLREVLLTNIAGKQSATAILLAAALIRAREDDAAGDALMPHCGGA